MGINFIDKDTEGALLETKGLLRRVRSAAGAARFGVPINSVIPAGGKPTHVSTRVNATGGGASIKPIKGLNRDLDEAVLKGRITIRRAREIQKRRNERGGSSMAQRANQLRASETYKRELAELDEVRKDLDGKWDVVKDDFPSLAQTRPDGSAVHVGRDANDPEKWASWISTADGDEVEATAGVTRAKAIAAAKSKTK